MSDDIWARVFASAQGKQPACPDEPTLTPEQAAGDSVALKKWLRNPIGSRKGIQKFQSFLSATDATAWDLLKIPNFLPKGVADGALNSLKASPSDSWHVQEAVNDAGRREDGAGSTQHRYTVGDGTIDSSDPTTVRHDSESCSASEAIAGVAAALQSLQPNKLAVFQAGRYTRGCFIEPHDDVAYKEVVDEATGCTIRYERELAVILYFTKSWQESMGGCFVDLATGLEHVPVFNSLVAFRVPRLHEVSEMLTDRERFSVFGWFYVPCKDQSTERTEGGSKKRKKWGQEQTQGGQQEHQKKKTKRKKKSKNRSKQNGQ
mmetsp:Transcript_32810/g.71568  ORF Transcript_32810/g.71568 Transcript_32810/m.71568 type:complete len:318 (-) Transcript_32810:142-1095(-)|eukprot:CAMPEP_0118936734 /NCGR_PEP_ID=MMETSP1169-20130426/20198_1 /TAXON_ID=36882 /ORGANISM="Pyramimonas obovata, Strain CCMP722" /LENGTH=317 /DNA_ID=CAMNT_0006880099 /DNA_START=191 /DNA_END=1144 /DNA_ORIENTATION=+